MTAPVPMEGDEVGKISLEYRYPGGPLPEGCYIGFTVSVTSGAFSGASSFYMPLGSLREAISSLSQIYRDLRGTYQMNDCESDDYIRFEFLTLGRVMITGQVGGSYNDQYLRYQFPADQTDVNSLISSLKRALMD